MNAEEAGKKLGRNPRLLRQWAAEGKVQGVFKIGVAWVASFEAWQAAASEIRKPGPKPKGLKCVLAFLLLLSFSTPLIGGCVTPMSKTFTLPYAVIHSGGTETISLAATHIDGAHLTYRGVDGPIYSTNSASGTTSAALPATPGGFNFNGHAAAYTAQVRNDGIVAQSFVAGLSTPWGVYYGSNVEAAPGATVTVSATAPGCGTGHVGETVYGGSSALGGLAWTVISQTTSCTTSGTKTEKTHDPKVTIAGSDTQHVGDLNEGIESAELDLAGFTTGSNVLTYTIEGSLHVERKIVITYQPTLAAPAFNYPATGSSLERDQIYFEAVAPTDAESDAATIHFKLRYSTSPAMAAPTTLDTSAAQANWTYWNGAAWAAFPAGGVAQGVKARYTPPAEPAIGTWFFDGQVKDAYAWCTASSIWHVHALLVIWGSYGLEIDGNPVKAFDMEVLETANGELGQFRIEVSNKGGTFVHAIPGDVGWTANEIAATDADVDRDLLHLNATGVLTAALISESFGGAGHVLPHVDRTEAQTFLLPGVMLKRVSLYLSNATGSAAGTTVALYECTDAGVPSTLIAVSENTDVPPGTAWWDFDFAVSQILGNRHYALLPLADVDVTWRHDGGAYGDGTHYTYTGGAWVDQASDMSFKVYGDVYEAWGEWITEIGFGPGTLTFVSGDYTPAASTLLYYLSPSAQMPGQGLEMALADGDVFTFTEFTAYRLRVYLAPEAVGSYAPVIDALTFTLAHTGPGAAMAYLDKEVDVGIRDATAHTERWHGKVFKVEPGPETSWLICSSGDQILADRLIVADYASDDLGTTLRTIVTAVCTPLVNTGIPASLGHTGALSLIGKRALDAFEEVRRRFGVLYYLYYDGTDWIVYVVDEEDLTAPTVAIMWDRVFEPPMDTYLRFFPEGLRLDYFTRDATTVKVIVRNSSPEVSGTATLSGIAAGDAIQRILYIDAALDAAECAVIAAAWLAVHGYDQVTVSGKIPLTTSVPFSQKIWVVLAEASLSESMAIQRKVHRPLSSPPHTEVTLGKFRPDDQDILARLLKAVEA